MVSRLNVGFVVIGRGVTASSNKLVPVVDMSLHQIKMNLVITGTW
jgi:hypothetical protein